MKLSFLLADNSELEFNPTKNTVTIGRSSQCDIVIPHEGMSRKHCEVQVKDGEVFLTDLGSVNGVFINGNKITPNSPTKFPVFLSASFGYVQNFKIELDENTNITRVDTSSLNSKPIMKSENTGKKTMPNLKRAEVAPKAQAVKEEPKSNRMKIMLVILVVIAAGVFYLYQDDSSGPEVSPAQTYE